MKQNTLSFETAATLAASRPGRALLRALAAPCRAPGHVPVVVVEGDAPPCWVGERAGYRTRGGTWIDHPSAYSRRGWSNMLYVHSTQRIEVGRDWRPLANAAQGGAP